MGMAGKMAIIQMNEGVICFSLALEDEIMFPGILPGIRRQMLIYIVSFKGQFYSVCLKS